MNKYPHEEAIKNIYPWQDTKVIELDYLLDGKPKNALNAWLIGRAYDDGEANLEVYHPDHQIDIWVSYGNGYTFSLEFNGKFIKMGKTITPLINKLNKLDLR